MPLSIARSHSDPPANQPARNDASAPHRDWRLHKHADYQRVYQSSRKQFSSSMTYFAAAQPAEYGDAGPRVGITAGKVLGKAVERNRIKRRMRAAILANLSVLDAAIDVVLHPKRSVLDAEWTALSSEVRRVFMKIQEKNIQDKQTRDNKKSQEGQQALACGGATPLESRA